MTLRQHKFGESAFLSKEGTGAGWPAEIWVLTMSSAALYTTFSLCYFLPSTFLSVSQGTIASRKGQSFTVCTQVVFDRASYLHTTK